MNNCKNDTKVQSVLAIPYKRTTCPTCGMAYSLQVRADVQSHKKYHTQFTSGVTWPQSLNMKPLSSFTIVRRERTNKLGKLKGSVSCKRYKVHIQTIDKLNKKHIEKVEQILSMVNKELNAVEDSKEWASGKFESSKAFVVLVEGKAVGLCTTDSINGAKWMIYKSQSVVPNQNVKNVRIGISRIWISTDWRQQGLAKEMLNCVMKHSVYGQVLRKSQIAFSQPSYSGTLLAKSFNGVRHKSGEYLIPVYIQ
ncbi:ECO1 [Candida theae]|uniref:N-acetyltransferase ECO1 n=1 Tax=Candida theae TaxID=1198502 RepID=A0AAD5BEB8_9ASCO|nr:ECO1 [Candida theae]KAI5958055.1 ECO1 [Candida theae]